MKKILNYILVLMLIVFVFSGCEDKTDLTPPAAPNPISGSANLTRFVTIGKQLNSRLSIRFAL